MPMISGTGLNDNDIDILEHRFSLKFPDGYRAFLRKYNGFYIKTPDACNIPFNKVDNNFISFDALFGDHFVNENFDIKNVNDEYLSELFFIEDVLIIGVDPGDNFYVLAMTGHLSGIYYWDRTHLHFTDNVQNYSIGEVNECGNLYKVTDSFDDFFGEVLKLTKGIPFS